MKETTSLLKDRSRLFYIVEQRDAFRKLTDSSWWMTGKEYFISCREANINIPVTLQSTFILNT